MEGEKKRRFIIIEQCQFGLGGDVEHEADVNGEDGGYDKSVSTARKEIRAKPRKKMNMLEKGSWRMGKKSQKEPQGMTKCLR